MSWDHAVLYNCAVNMHFLQQKYNTVIEIRRNTAYLPPLENIPWRQSKSDYKMKNKPEVYNSHTYKQQIQSPPWTMPVSSLLYMFLTSSHSSCAIRTQNTLKIQFCSIAIGINILHKWYLLFQKSHIIL